MVGVEQQANQALWNELVGIHLRAPQVYEVEAFRAGKSTLRQIELTEVGDVRGKRLLHLQCHFGMDTLSWAMRGAQVVGTDFSAKAIAQARQLSDETSIPAQFVCSNVEELPAHVSGEFDIVFTSYGVLCWLADLSQWGKNIANFLAPGGFFYIVEQHPLGAIFHEEAGNLIASGSYFATGPVKEISDGSYADRTAVLKNKTSYQWQHPLSEVVNAMADSGLRIDFLHEFPFCMFDWLPSMKKDDDGWYRHPNNDQLPFLFSLKASQVSRPQCQ